MDVVVAAGSTAQRGVGATDTEPTTYRGFRETVWTWPGSTKLIDRRRDVLRGLGFPEPIDLGTLESIAHLFRATRSEFVPSPTRTGVYALLLPDDRIYVGQASEVVRRFAQHRRALGPIEAVSFMPVPAMALDARERAGIRAVEAAGLRIANVVHVSDVQGERDLDVLVSPDLQERWLRDPLRVNAEERSRVALVELPPVQRDRFAERFRRLEAHPHGRVAVHLLATYLGGAVPRPRTTEYAFWSVSCLPATGGTAWPRLVCVNAGMMELFVVGGRADATPIWGYVIVALDVLESMLGGQRGFRRRHRSVEIEASTYRDAGAHQARLRFASEQDAAHLLFDPDVQRAAGALALRVMRKRATIYGKFHCKPLADRALQLVA